jgi:hypothetical protein
MVDILTREMRLGRDRAALAFQLRISLINKADQWHWKDPLSQNSIYLENTDIELVVCHRVCYLHKPGEIHFTFFQRWRLKRSFKTWFEQVGKEKAILNQIRTVNRALTQL